MKPIEIFKGSDLTITVTTNEDLSAATEVLFYVDTEPQIKKSLTGGGISGVTATQFTVQIDAADTESLAPGEYLMQTRYTSAAGKKIQGKFTPNKIKIRDSAFVTNRNVQYGDDYNG